MTNSIQHGMKRSVLTIFGDLSANALQMTAAAFGLARDHSDVSDGFPGDQMGWCSLLTLDRHTALLVIFQRRSNGQAN